MATKRNNEAVYKLVITAIFMALTAFLQLFASSFTIGTVSFSVVLIPIVICGILAGPLSGALCGLTFGVITMIGGLTGGDIFTATLMQSGTKGFIITTLICLVKATAAGLLSALVYKALKNKNNFWAVVCASATAPIANTGLFILGALTLSDVLSAAFTNGASVIYFLVIGCAGINFIIEFLVNLIFAPAVYQLIKAVGKGKI
ncbi:MAG: ECF transporter S component [Acutalibacteraceae bacterium]|nr:ECF transporter S component [Acutalibacteraceae bacterium]